MKINFIKGILGFEEVKTYEMKELEFNPIFKDISSLEKDDVGFIIVSPFEIDSKYDIEIDDNTIKELKIETVKDILLYNIITLNESIDKSTVNLRAPIVINIKNNFAKQIVLQDESYDIKHPLMRRR